jgi:NADH dehydrogenase
MQVAVLGAGYAGITLASRLESTLPDHVDIVVVDESETHLVKHEVHRVIRRPAVADVIQVPLSELLDRATVRTDRVTAIDRDERAVHLAGGGDLSYDYVAVCLGSVTADYGIPGVAEHGLTLSSIDDAHGVRTAFLSAAGVDTAGGDGVRRGDAPDRLSSDGGANATASAGGADVVVGGAGLSGVQTAGELVALAREESVTADVTLLEQQPHVAPNFPANFRRAVREALEERGVAVSTGTTVERATEGVVETDRGSFDADVFVWTGGITGSEAMGGDRPLVHDDLRIDRRAFAVGDAAKAVDADGESVPASASAAIREAKTVATNIARLVDHDLDDDGGFVPRLDPYRFDVPGWIVTVGDGTVAQLGPEVVTGRPAGAMKAAVGAGHLSSIGAMRDAVDLAESELVE